MKWRVSTLLPMAMLIAMGCKAPQETADDIDWSNIKTITTDSKDPLEQYQVKSLQLEIDKDWKGLLQAADDWLASHPDSGDGWGFKGSAYNQLGQPKLAIPALRKAIEVQPDDWVHWGELGDALEATGDPQGASEARAKMADLKSREETH